MSSDPSSSPDSPPPSHWPLSLGHLLNSSTGKNLFLEYLRNEDEGLSFPLLFLLAVDGLHGVAEESSGDQETMNSINLIFEKLLPSVSCISEEIKGNIRRNISSYSVSVYDEAVEEVRDYLSQNLYPNFLKSEFYLAAFNHDYGNPHHTSSSQVFDEKETASEVVEDHKEDSQAVSCSYQSLQTVHEEEVLSLKRPKPFQLAHEILRAQSAKKVSGIGTGPSNSSPYHAQYSGYTPVSRQDSETQSVSSGCTDDSIGDRRRIRIDKSKKNFQEKTRSDRIPKNILPADTLPPLITHIPLPKREEYINYRMAEKDPKAFAELLTEALKAMVMEDRLNRSEHKRKHNIPESSNITASIRPQNQFGVKQGYGPAIDSRTLQTQLRKLEEASHGENINHVEEPELEGQAILDQHVRRVWKDSTTPELSRSPRNEFSDSRKQRRSQPVAAAVSHSVTVLTKGKSMQTLDSGIGGDKDLRSHKIRPPPPIPRWTQEHFIDSGLSDAEKSSVWDSSDYSGRTVLERPRPSESGPSRRMQPPPSQLQQPVQHRRHSPPTEETVNVYVNYESGGEPYLIKIPKSKLTLGVLKSKMSMKKGIWKYLFRINDADDKDKFINYELKRDEDLMPLFQNYVCVTLKPIHPPSDIL